MLQHYLAKVIQFKGAQNRLFTVKMVKYLETRHVLYHNMSMQFNLRYYSLCST